MEPDDIEDWDTSVLIGHVNPISLRATIKSIKKKQHSLLPLKQSLIREIALAKCGFTGEKHITAAETFLAISSWTSEYRKDIKAVKKSLEATALLLKTEVNSDALIATDFANKAIIELNYDLPNWNTVWLHISDAINIERSWTSEESLCYKPVRYRLENLLESYAWCKGHLAIPDTHLSVFKEYDQTFSLKSKSNRVNDIPLIDELSLLPETLIDLREALYLEGLTL